MVAQCSRRRTQQTLGVIIWLGLVQSSVHAECKTVQHDWYKPRPHKYDHVLWKGNARYNSRSNKSLNASCCLAEQQHRELATQEGHVLTKRCSVFENRQGKSEEDQELTEGFRVVDMQHPPGMRKHFCTSCPAKASV